MLKYEQLSKELQERIREEREKGKMPQLAFPESAVIRRDPSRDQANVIRTAFIRDIDKIIHCPYYNRYADKTQVFSFYKNDDITRRGLHVQLVSRIARTIGKALNLNLDLIEAISLGHDLGHTPFGHAGEEYLDQLFYANSARHFSHNIHSVRVLDRIYPYNVSLQTLNGIASHDGELEMSEYHPKELADFAEFDRQIEACYLDKKMVRKLIPATLEGCVMRISDIIAYLGKDRQDAQRARLIDHAQFEEGALGVYNAQIINNLIVNIVEHSYGMPYIKMDEEHFSALSKAKAANYALIYKSDAIKKELEESVRPMMEMLYNQLKKDLLEDRRSSPIFTHHIAYVNEAHYRREIPYEQTDADQLVVDYIASMTDDYFIDLFAYLFPKSNLKILYRGYFDDERSQPQIII